MVTKWNRKDSNLTYTNIYKPIPYTLDNRQKRSKKRKDKEKR